MMIVMTNGVHCDGDGGDGECDGGCDGGRRRRHRTDEVHDERRGAHVDVVDVPVDDWRSGHHD